ncbi:hypothetical protein PHYSODRAFT_285815 [Phytophthora sojae]|uniref:RxLR effector protein n=2 Tax=Phytophthora sojae TaxID=67593 RepID=G4ZFT9_PHYSP|nr:hypothetical protein PHYSODRAFT_285815 [Phytophthora sojae]AEK81013.1 Avh243 [Phytophthora sojae]AEK81014.1 Avh243 [Phytophthora sojae]AEK81015.1 Avh243 [Phytophthora sojae]EGZ16623.1 hypothetical protein PHYSODRAFT_285815 [Phytophthora sojae]|eukprot:XP_009525681.1 hypothetical protein PHYSODRAFT_285815 [Phytophthora sojae]
MRLSSVVLATIVTLLASTNAVEVKNSIDSLNVAGPAVGEQRFLRVHKGHASTQNKELALTEERAMLTAVTKVKDKLFKLKMKIAMPSIKKLLEGVVKDILK